MNLNRYFDVIFFQNFKSVPLLKRILNTFSNVSLFVSPVQTKYKNCKFGQVE